MRYLSYLSIIIGFFLNINIGCVRAEPLLLPQELHEVALRKDCTQIDNFYNRPGMIEPPFVYGYMPGPKENSAVFWCESKKKGKYYLVIVNNSKGTEASTCTDIVPWMNYPGGLSIYNDKNTLLDDFVYIDDPQKKPPEGIKLTNNGILSYYDGVEVIFYCHKGKWIVRQRH